MNDFDHYQGWGRRPSRKVDGAVRGSVALTFDWTPRSSTPGVGGGLSPKKNRDRYSRRLWVDGTSGEDRSYRSV